MSVKTLKLRTLELQNMMQKVMKGVIDNKMIPITSLIELRLEKNTLSITATDQLNFIRVYQDKVMGEDFVAVFKAEIFNKLVQKTTSSDITLTLDLSHKLCFKGNGSYTFALPLDENNELIQYPLIPNVIGKESDITFTAISKIINANKPALATTMELPCITGYYFGDSVLTTDSFKMACTKIKVFETPFLMSSFGVELLKCLNDENIIFIRDGSKLTFKSYNPNANSGVIIHTTEMDGIESFMVNELQSIIDDKMESSCKVSKDIILDAIDRVALFIGDYDKRAINLTFTIDGIMISSKDSNASEIVKYGLGVDEADASINFKPFTCCIDSQMLKDIISAQSRGCVNIEYGSNICIKMMSDNIIHCLAFLEDNVSA